MSDKINVKNYIKTDSDDVTLSSAMFFIKNLPLYDSIAANKRATIARDYFKAFKKEINEEAGTNDMPEDLIQMYEDLKIMFDQIINYEDRIVRKGRW